jgi:hypothetical protein
LKEKHIRFSAKPFCAWEPSKMVVPGISCCIGMAPPRRFQRFLGELR